jgi:hypothetical protein
MPDDQLPLAAHLARDCDEAQRRIDHRRRQNELDSQIDGALRRIELRLSGQDVHKVLAEAISASVTQVHDWIARRGNRRPPAELVHELCHLDEVFSAWWNETTGYEVPKKRPPVRTWQEERDLYRSRLRRFGEEGERALREIDGSRPRPQVVSSGGST